MGENTKIELQEALSATPSTTCTTICGRISSRRRSDSYKENVTCTEEIISQESVSLQTFAHLNIKKINRKIDIRLIPILTVLYLLSFLDRGK